MTPDYGSYKVLPRIQFNFTYLRLGGVTWSCLKKVTLLPCFIGDVSSFLEVFFLVFVFIFEREREREREKKKKRE